MNDPRSLDLSAMLRVLAQRARPAGSDSEAAARAECRRWLEARGYVCRDQAFHYSAWPGRYGPAAIGWLAVLAALTVAILAGQVRLTAGMTVAALLWGAVLVGGRWMLRYGTLAMPWARRAGVNLEAVPGNGANPRVWLVAHLDSKSQTISMRVRIASVTLTLIAWVALVACWALFWATGTGTCLLGCVALGYLAALSALPLAVCFVGEDGAGALDNASGVVAVLAAADALAAEPENAEQPVGVLITSAEELGLAGARAWLAARAGGSARGIAINCDGVDDVGALVAMTRGYMPSLLRDILQEGGHAADAPVTVRRLVPGVLVDSVAFEDAGWRAVTVSRGTWRTFARIHTVRDDLTQLRGDGLASAARLLAAVARRSATVADQVLNTHR